MRLVLIVLSSILATNLAHAKGSMKTGGRTSQPIGHAWFCQQLPSECDVISKSVPVQELTRDRWRDLVEINTYSNSVVEPVTDQEYYGVEEHWTYPKSYGDCEDYVLLKRYMLLQRGWSEANLLITVVRQPNGDGHAVLTARTSKGDFVLDNLVSDVKRWDKTPYTYLKRQSSNHSGRWTDILDNRKQLASK